MAEFRLSKLQKWIINRICENTTENRHKGLNGQTMPIMYRDEIYQDFFKLSRLKHGSWPAAKRVTVSRSLKKLKEQGLIVVPRHIRPKGCIITLSEKYMKALTEEMLNVNKTR